MSGPYLNSQFVFPRVSSSRYLKTNSVFPREQRLSDLLYIQRKKTNKQTKKANKQTSKQAFTKQYFKAFLFRFRQLSAGFVDRSCENITPPTSLSQILIKCFSLTLITYHYSLTNVSRAGHILIYEGHVITN